MQLIEILGLVFGLLYLFSMINEKWYSWPFGIIAVSLYGYSCYQYQIYGEFSLQFIYFILAIYGWWKWTRNKNETIFIEQIKQSDYLKVLFTGLLISLVFYFILKALDSTIPALDAISNGFSIIATYLAAKKKIENWIIWIPVNILISYMMYVKSMPFYLILYICYAAFAILGYFQWKKSLKNQSIEI